MVQSFQTNESFGKNIPTIHASNMRDLEYQFHTTVEIVWVALLSFAFVLIARGRQNTKLSSATQTISTVV